MKDILPLIILGSGPAGLSASIYASRARIKHIIISGNLKGGPLINSPEIENYPGFISVKGIELINSLEQHANHFNATIINDTIKNINTSSKPFILEGENSTYYSKAIIIATGSSYKKLEVKGELEFLGRGVSYCATCDGNFYKNKDVAVVGGGNTAVEDALYLSNLAKTVYLIHRRDSLRAEKIMQESLFKKSNIQILWNTTVKEIKGSDFGVEKLVLNNTLSNTTTELSLHGIFIAIGSVPNTEFLNNQLKLNKNNYIITNSPSSETSVKGIFAAGDVQNEFYKQAIISAASGAIAALDVNKYLFNNHD